MKKTNLLGVFLGVFLPNFWGEPLVLPICGKMTQFSVKIEFQISHKFSTIFKNFQKIFAEFQMKYHKYLHQQPHVRSHISLQVFWKNLTISSKPQSFKGDEQSEQRGRRDAKNTCLNVWDHPCSWEVFKRKLQGWSHIWPHNSQFLSNTSDRGKRL